MAGRYVLLRLFFELTSSLHVTERNYSITRLRHMFGSESDMKKDVQIAGIPMLKTWRPKCLISGSFYDDMATET